MSFSTITLLVFIFRKKSKSLEYGKKFSALIIKINLFDTATMCLWMSKFTKKYYVIKLTIVM